MTEIQPSLVCAAAAAQQRKPFWVSITYPGIDSTVVGGLVGTSEGVVYRFDFDSDPCGGAGCGSRFTTERCDHPSLAQRGDSDVPKNDWSRSK